MKTAISVAFLIATTASTSLAFAGEFSDAPPKRVVRYADLDLSRPAGAAALYARIGAAARDVCAPVSADALATLVPVRLCTEAAVARAVAEVNAPVLTTYHLARTGRHSDTSQVAAVAGEQGEARAAGESN